MTLDYVEIAAKAMHDRRQEFAGCTLSWAKLPEDYREYDRLMARTMIEACRTARAKEPQPEKDAGR